MMRSCACGRADCPGLCYVEALDWMPARGLIPRVGELAGQARARGCRVPDVVGDEAFVERVDDLYPLRYAWSVFWSDGVVTGVREESE